jgi:hypothetical protein
VVGSEDVEPPAGGEHLGADALLGGLAREERIGHTDVGKAG